MKIELSSMFTLALAKFTFRYATRKNDEFAILRLTCVFHVYPFFSRTIATIFLLKISRSTFFSIATLHIPTISYTIDETLYFFLISCLINSFENVRID